MMYIGLDVGGTNICAVLSDETGRVYDAYTRKSDYYGKDYLKNIYDIIQYLIHKSRQGVSGIGIGVPGTVNPEKGEVVVCPAFQWKGLPLKEHVEKTFGIPTFIENDVNAWTLAEKHLGAAKNCTDFVMVTIGTGIGCGLFLGGRIYRGSTYEAGEIGYLPVDVKAYDKQFTSQDFGFFESQASALATCNRYFNLTNKSMECKEIFQLAKTGDKDAIRTIDDTYRYLGLGIGAVICVLNPQMVVLGGGMVLEGEQFLNNLVSKVRQLVPFNAEICLSQTGIYGGAIGSALCACIPC